MGEVINFQPRLCGDFAERRDLGLDATLGAHSRVLSRLPTKSAWVYSLLNLY